MSKYIVTKDFTDINDANHIYRTGDFFPRKGKVTKKRFEELSTEKNKRGVQLIEEVDDGE